MEYTSLGINLVAWAAALDNKMFCFVLFFDVYMSSKLHGWKGEAVREEGLNGVHFFCHGV
jgi:hypothetical protein